MQPTLSYMPSKGYFIWAGPIDQWRIPYDAGFTKHLDLSKNGKAVYFTECPYAAVSMAGIASDGARAELEPLIAEYRASQAIDPPEGFKVPAPPGEKYLPYQLAGIHYASQRSHVLFADEPGLGKTVEAIGWANYMGVRRILVVCPATVRIQWQLMLRKWIVGRPIRTHAIVSSRSGVSPVAEAVIISYDLLRNPQIFSILRRRQWDLLVLDEAHALKNYAAQRTSLVLGSYSEPEKGLIAAARKVAALTGTPTPNRPREAYTLARGLDHSAIDWMSEDGFADRFNASMTFETSTGKIGTREQTGRLPELQARLRTNFMVRREKAEVLRDLPAVQFEMVTMDHNSGTKAAVKAEKLLNIDPEQLQKALGDSDIMGHISVVRKQMGLAKVPLIHKHVEMLLEGGRDKVALFVHHKEVLARLTELLKKYRPAVVKGGMGSVGKHQQVEVFRKMTRCRVFLGSLLASGTGLDGLQDVCDTVILGEPDWVPGNNQQAIDRLHRMGQGGSVLAQFLVVPESLDSKILSSQMRKLSAIDLTLDARLDGD